MVEIEGLLLEILLTKSFHVSLITSKSNKGFCFSSLLVLGFVLFSLTFNSSSILKSVISSFFLMGGSLLSITFFFDSLDEISDINSEIDTDVSISSNFKAVISNTIIG